MPWRTPRPGRPDSTLRAFQELPARKKPDGSSTGGAPFLSLDYLYTPSQDVAADMKFFSEVLGGRIAFAIDAMGARVAKVVLASGPPHILLTDHLEGERPVLVYRVADLEESVATLRKRGFRKGRNVELPMGTCRTFSGPGGHRVALYEMSRPGVADHFEGRRDF